jgi:hypothetical protein
MGFYLFKLDPLFSITKGSKFMLIYVFLIDERFIIKSGLIFYTEAGCSEIV